MGTFCLCFRIERLWRDVWTSVTHLYYNVLHSLEAPPGLLDLADTVHMFCVQHVFLPRLAAALHTFTEGWDIHPLKSEGGLTPNQLWVLGHMQNPAAETEQDLQVCDIYMDVNCPFVLKVLFNIYIKLCFVCVCKINDRTWSCRELTGRHLMVSQKNPLEFKSQKMSVLCLQLLWKL